MVHVINYGANASSNAAEDNYNKSSNGIDRSESNDISDDEANSIKLIHLLAYGQNEGNTHQGITNVNGIADKVTYHDKLPIVWTTSTSIDARRTVSLLFPQLLS